MSEGELRLLGLGRRAGVVTVGTTGVRAALTRGELALVVVARNTSERTRQKVVRLARAKGVRTMIGPDDIELGRRLGRGAVQAVGVRDDRLAAGIGPGRATKQR